MNTFKLLVWVSLYFFLNSVYAQQRHTAQLTIQVKDNDGNPVSGVEVGASTISGHKAGPEFGTDEYRTVTGKSDANGSTTLTIPCFVDYGSVSMGVAYGVMVGAEPKPGFYQSEGLSYGIHFTNVVSGKWQPWSPTLEVVMQKVGIQVPMFAKKVWQAQIPSQGKSAGYDLMAGDWVTPDGKGQIADLLFDFVHKTNGTVRTSSRNTERQLLDNSLAISFSNKGDGIQSTTATRGGLLMPRLAPTNGYQPTLIKRDFETTTNIVIIETVTRTIRHSDFDRNANYFFRVRTKTDEQGNITNALYGKIYGEFNPDFRQGRIGFTYYLNPEPNSRNMEFNTKSNLFRNLPSLEQVSAP
jgi:hypothetical protein